MAGGVATPELAAAVSNVGGIGFLAAGYGSASDLRSQIDHLESLTSRPFGVNVFVPQPSFVPARDLAAYTHQLEPEAQRYGVALGTNIPDEQQRWHDIVDHLVEHPVPIVSFTFGAPERALVDRLRRAGSYVVTTVTSISEALTASHSGVDALCLQGVEAGGHRATFDPAAEPNSLTTIELLRAAGMHLDPRIPLIAAGGIATGQHITNAFAARASAVQLGTAFLRSIESGASPTHQAALVDPQLSATVVTRAFSGRPARSLKNQFVANHGAAAPSAYPEVHYLTAPIRKAAATADDPQALALWAGTEHSSAENRSAADIVTKLWNARLQTCDTATH
ncbi:nitronate monooxygenase [Rhodococcus enclensis]|nr:nitronate monooxygenase [Rhodococcus qingshengii]